MADAARMKNCRRTPYGWQFYTRIRGQLVTEHFRPHELKNGREPTPREVTDWVGAQRAIATGTVMAADPDDGPTFAQDVAAYLPLVRTMPSLRDRKDDLDRWVRVFGTRSRRSITATMIRQQLEAWRAEGYAASTVNHRRTALMHLWTVLDGKSAPNPARDVPRYLDASAQAPPRDLSYAAIRAVFKAMGDSDSKARLELMAWTGWPQAQIARLEPADIAWNKAVFVKARRKGKGVAGAWLPLLPQAWTALRRFMRRDCRGPFSTSSMRAAFRRAAERVTKDPRVPKTIRAELRDITPYQLRHSFGTLLAGISQDDRAVKTLMLHSDVRQTHRYTNATVSGRAADAIRLATLATFSGVSRGAAGRARK